MKAYMEMLPRLKAEESLEQIGNMAAASGTMEERARNELIRELQKMIGQEIKQRKLTPYQAKTMIENMGIEVNLG